MPFDGSVQSFWRQTANAFEYSNDNMTQICTFTKVKIGRIIAFMAEKSEKKIREKRTMEYDKKND